MANDKLNEEVLGLDFSGTLVCESDGHVLHVNAARNSLTVDISRKGTSITRLAPILKSLRTNSQLLASFRKAAMHSGIETQVRISGAVVLRVGQSAQGQPSGCLGILRRLKVDVLALMGALVRQRMENLRMLR